MSRVDARRVRLPLPPPVAHQHRRYGVWWPRNPRTEERRAVRHDQEAVEEGPRDADLVGSSSTDDKQSGDVDPMSETTGHHRLRRINLPAESFGRPEQWKERPAVPVAEGTSIGRGRVPVAALSAGPVGGDGFNRDAQSRTEQVRPGRSPIEPGDVRGKASGWTPTREALTRNLVPLEGVVVAHPFPRLPEATLVHDSETIIAADGVGPRLFDPATKSSVRIDCHGNVIDEGGNQ